MLREDIVTTEMQHDLDNLGIAKNAREEKIRARDAKLKQDAENARMAKLYREHVLKEQPAPGLVSIASLAAGAGQSPPPRRWKSRKKSAASATKLSLLMTHAAGPEFPGRRFCFYSITGTSADSMMRWSARQQAQSMDASRGDNDTVTRIAQRVAHGSHFVSNIRSEGNDPKRRISVQLMEHAL